MKDHPLDLLCLIGIKILAKAWLRKHFIIMKNMNAMNINCVEDHLLALLCLISPASPKVLMAHACENCKKLRNFIFSLLLRPQNQKQNLSFQQKDFHQQTLFSPFPLATTKTAHTSFLPKTNTIFPKATLVITWPKRASIICGQIYLTNGVAERIVFTILIPTKAYV